MAAEADALRHFVEDMALFFEQTGVPRTAGRVLAYLLVCDPPHQTMNDLMEALQMSKSSVSSATITLIQFKLIERVSLPGIRRDYYRVEDGVWNKVIYRRLIEMQKMRELAEKGLHILENESGERTSRLREMYDLYKFLEHEMPKIIQAWEAEHADKK